LSEFKGNAGTADVRRHKRMQREKEQREVLCWARVLYR
jgi:hypothetical protein